MKSRGIVFITLVVAALSVLTPMLVLAANAMLSIGLTAGSDCDSARIDLNVTLDVDAAREYGRTSLSDGTTLMEFEQSSGIGTTFTGSYGFVSWVPQPAGTIISLYGYIGQTPPSAADTVEFFLAYRCDTGEVLATCGGPYSACPQTYTPVVGGVCLNTLDGRLNNSSAFDCAAPIVLYHNGDRLDVYGVGNGQSQVVFSIPDTQIVSGSTDQIASGNISGTGQPVKATLLGDGRLLIEALYQDGKPYTIVYDPKGAPPVTNLLW